KEAERDHFERELYLQWNLDQSKLKLRGELPGAEGEIVQEALVSRADAYGVNPATGIFDPYASRLADALVELASTSGDRTSRPTQVSLIVDLTALVEESGGFGELS